jgi:hypothetical protein
LIVEGSLIAIRRDEASERCKSRGRQKYLLELTLHRLPALIDVTFTAFEAQIGWLVRVRQEWNDDVFSWRLAGARVLSDHDP